MGDREVGGIKQKNWKGKRHSKGWESEERSSPLSSPLSSALVRDRRLYYLL